jgi:arabinan endo-1,5-alpha-L-arabinosidase
MLPCFQAPDITRIGNLYYLLYTVSKFGSQESAIGYATSTSMDVGSWTDHGATGVASRKGSPYNAIDGNLVVSGGRTYMAYGSFWQNLHISQVSIGDGSMRKTGGDTQIAYQPSGAHEMEAPALFENGGKWWLFYSAGKCCGLDKNRPGKGQEYRIMACVSSGGPTGPFNDKNGKSCRNGGGTVVLPSHSNVYAPGGQGVYRDPTLGPILYYHYGKKFAFGPFSGLMDDC